MFKVWLKRWFESNPALCPLIIGSYFLVIALKSWSQGYFIDKLCALILFPFALCILAYGIHTVVRRFNNPAPK